MRTPITYYGGKQRLTKTIVSMIPPHKVYIEPFFGGGAVFFAKKPSYLEVINDINDNVVTFYRVCQNEAQFQELSAKIQATLFSEALFLQAKTIWNGYYPASDIERGIAMSFEEYVKIYGLTFCKQNYMQFADWLIENGIAKERPKLEY